MYVMKVSLVSNSDGPSMVLQEQYSEEQYSEEQKLLIRQDKIWQNYIPYKEYCHRTQDEILTIREGSKDCQQHLYNIVKNYEALVKSYCDILCKDKIEHNRPWGATIEKPPLVNHKVFQKILAMYCNSGQYKNYTQEELERILRKNIEIITKKTWRPYTIDALNTQAQLEQNFQFYYKFEKGWSYIPTNIYKSCMLNAQILDGRYFGNRYTDVEASFFEKNIHTLVTCFAFLGQWESYRSHAQKKKEYYQAQESRYATLDIYNQKLKDLCAEEAFQLLTSQSLYLNEQQITLEPILKRLAHVAPTEAKEKILEALDKAPDQRLEEIIKENKLKCTVEEFKLLMQDLDLTPESLLPLAIKIALNGITKDSTSQIIELCKQAITQKQNTPTETLVTATKTEYTTLHNRDFDRKECNIDPYVTTTLGENITNTPYDTAAAA